MDKISDHSDEPILPPDDFVPIFKPEPEVDSVWTPKGRTDSGNARRFVDRNKDRVRYCSLWKKWLVWDGMRWKVDEDDSIMRLGMELADSYWQTAGDNDDVRKFAAQTANARKIEAFLKLAQALVPIHPTELNQNGWLLNCANGTVDLRTGELRKHRREDNFTKASPTRFNPDADSYHWDRFLESVFDFKQGVINYVQRLLGYAMLGIIIEHVLAIFWGQGANGKSTLLNAIMQTLGSDYSCKAKSDLLLMKRHEGHPTVLADLFGMRIVNCVETAAGRRLDEVAVKELTGGDPIRTRRMHEDFWQFDPSHTLIICTNHRPVIRGTEQAIWRRLRLVPFNVTFADSEQDRELPSKLRSESEGILAWLVRGCIDWKKNGLTMPESVQHVTEEYRKDQDVVGRFIDERCETTTGKVKFSLFRKALHEWCESEGMQLPTATAIGSYLTEKGFEKQKSNGIWYKGLGLLE